MQVLKITENEDGSATVDIDMTEEENNILLNYAINNILRKQMESKDDNTGKSRNNYSKE